MRIVSSLLAVLALGACALPTIEAPSAITTPCPLVEDVIESEAVLFMSMRQPDCAPGKSARLTDLRADAVRFGVRPVGAHDNGGVPAFLSYQRWEEELAARGGGNPTLLYIHGFNNNARVSTQDARAIARSIDHKGAVVTLFWPTLTGPETYYWSVTNRDWTQPYADALLRNLAARKEGVILFGHSMGARLALDAAIALGERHPAMLARIDQVILASPDIDRSDMIGKLRRVAAIEGAPPVTVYASTRDKILQTAWLTNGYPRGGDLGSVYPGLLGNGPTPPLYPEPIAANVTIVDTSDVSQGLSGHADYVYSPETAADICRVVKKIDHEEARFPAKRPDSGQQVAGSVVLRQGNAPCFDRASNAVAWLESVD
ncbi:MAG: alpha/beta fold hydrolase [Sphingomonas sp.]|nr:alpha/beta fold hydrolase [Sphingomonas sp.]